MSDRAMLRRFKRVPREGTVVDEADPLVGWRVERVEDGRLFNVGRDGWLRADRCTLQPASLVRMPRLSSPLGAGGHEAPHPRCECGPRLLGDLDGLSDFWADTYRGTIASGLTFRHRHETDDLALVRMAAHGSVTPGHAIPYDDPPGSIRVNRAQVREIYTPGWVDRRRVQARNPEATVRPITDLGGDLFAWMRHSKPPEATLLWQSRPTTVWVKTAVAELEIPRSWLQPERVMSAIRNVLTREYGAPRGLETVMEACVYPLIDLDEISDPNELAGLSLGVAYALGHVSIEDNLEGQE